jgi:hypothetical protein
VIRLIGDVDRGVVVDAAGISPARTARAFRWATPQFTVLHWDASEPVIAPPPFVAFM